MEMDEKAEMELIVLLRDVCGYNKYEISFIMDY